jgi:hypothetical protein
MQEENPRNQKVSQAASEEKKPAPEGELPEDELEQVSGGLATTLSNLANMRHEMLKAVANNLRG